MIILLCRTQGKPSTQLTEKGEEGTTQGKKQVEEAGAGGQQEERSGKTFTGGDGLGSILEILGMQC